MNQRKLKQNDRVILIALWKILQKIHCKEPTDEKKKKKQWGRKQQISNQNDKIM